MNKSKSQEKSHSRNKQPQSKRVQINTNQSSVQSSTGNSPISPQTMKGSQALQRPETQQSGQKQTPEVSLKSQVVYNPHIDIVQIQRVDPPQRRGESPSPGSVSYPAKSRGFSKSPLSPTGPSDSTKYRNFRNNQKKYSIVNAMSQIDFNSMSMERIATTHKLQDAQERETNSILEQLNKRYTLQRQLHQNQVRVPSTSKSLRDQYTSMNLSTQRNFLAATRQVSRGQRSQKSLESGESNENWKHSPLYFYDSKVAAQQKIKSLVNLPQTQEQINEQEESPRVNQSNQSLPKKSARSTSAKKLVLQSSQKRKPEKQQPSPQQFYMVQQEKNTYRYDGAQHYRELLEKNTQNQNKASEEKESQNRTSKPSLFAVNNPDLDEELRKQQPRDTYNFNKSSISLKRQKFGQNSSQKKSLLEHQSSIKNIQQKVNTNSSFEMRPSVEAQEQAPLFLMKLNTSSRVLQRNTSGSFESNRNNLQIFKPPKSRANSSHFRLSYSGKVRQQQSKQVSSQSKATLEYQEERPLMHEQQIQEYLENYENKEKLDDTRREDLQRDHDAVMIDLHNLDVKISRTKVHMRTQRHQRVTSAAQLASSNQLTQKKSQQNILQNASKPRRTVAKISSRNQSYKLSSKQGGKQFTNIVIVPKVESANAQMQSDHLSIRSANYQNPIYSDDSNQNDQVQFSFRGTDVKNTTRLENSQIEKKFEVVSNQNNNIVSINEMQSTQRLNTQERSQREKYLKDSDKVQQTLMFSTRNHFQMQSGRVKGSGQNVGKLKIQGQPSFRVSSKEKTPKETVDTPGDRSFGGKPNDDSIFYQEYTQGKFLKGGRYFQNHHPSIQQVQSNNQEDTQSKENQVKNSFVTNQQNTQDLKQKQQTFGRKATVGPNASVPMSLDDAQSKRKTQSNIRTPLSCRDSERMVVSTGIDQPDKPFLETTRRVLKSQKEIRPYKLGSQLFSPLSVKVFKFQEAMNHLANNTSNNLLARNLQNQLPSDIEKQEKVAQMTISEAQKQQEFFRGYSSTNIDKIIAVRPKPKSQQTKLRKNIGEILALTQEPLCFSQTFSKNEGERSKSSDFQMPNDTMIIISSDDQSFIQINPQPDAATQDQQQQPNQAQHDNKKPKPKTRSKSTIKRQQMILKKFDNIEDLLLCDPKLLFQKKQRLRALQDLKNKMKSDTNKRQSQRNISSELDTKLMSLIDQKQKRDQSREQMNGLQNLQSVSSLERIDCGDKVGSKCGRCQRKNFKEQMVKLARSRGLGLAQMSPFQSGEGQDLPMSESSRQMWISNLKMLSDVKNIYKIQKILNEHDRLLGATPDSQNLSPQSQVALFNQFCIKQGLISPNKSPDQKIPSLVSNSPKSQKFDKTQSPSSNDLEMQNQSQMAKMSQLDDSVLQGKYLAESKYKNSNTRNQGSQLEPLETSNQSISKDLFAGQESQNIVNYKAGDYSLSKIQLFQDQKFEAKRQVGSQSPDDNSGISCQLDPWRQEQSNNQFINFRESRDSQLNQKEKKVKSQSFKLANSPQRLRRITVQRECRASHQFMKKQSFDALFEAQHSYSLKQQKLQNHRKERLVANHKNSTNNLMMQATKKQDITKRVKTGNEFQSQKQIFQSDKNVFTLPTRVTSPMSLNIPNVPSEARNPPEVLSDQQIKNQNTDDSLFETQAYQGIRFKKTKSTLVSRNQKLITSQNLSQYSKQHERSSGQNASINLLKRAAKQRKEQTSKQQNQSEFMVSKIQIGDHQGTKFWLKKHPQKAEFQCVKMARPPEGQVSSEHPQDKSFESMAIQMSKQQKGKFEDSMQANLELVCQRGATDKTFDVDLDGECTTQINNQSGNGTARKKPSQMSQNSQHIRGWSGKDSRYSLVLGQKEITDQGQLHQACNKGERDPQELQPHTKRVGCSRQWTEESLRVLTKNTSYFSSISSKDDPYLQGTEDCIFCHFNRSNQNISLSNINFW